MVDWCTYAWLSRRRCACEIILIISTYPMTSKRSMIEATFFFFLAPPRTMRWLFSMILLLLTHTVVVQCVLVHCTDLVSFFWSSPLWHVVICLTMKHTTNISRRVLPSERVLPHSRSFRCVSTSPRTSFEDSFPCQALYVYVYVCSIHTGTLFLSIVVFVFVCFGAGLWCGSC